MLRILLLLVFFLSLLAGITLYLMQAPGLAVFTYGDVMIELPLVRFFIGACIAVAGLFLVLRMLGFVFNAPLRIQAARYRHRRRKAAKDTLQGLTWFAAGDWTQAEKLLIRGADETRSEYINYMWAANAAQQSGNYELRDQYLEQAKKSLPGKQVALDILQAEFLLQQGLPKQALESIEPYSGQISSNPKIADLFADSYEQLEDWQQLASLIPDLEKNNGFAPEKLASTREKAVRGLLAAFMRGETAEDIEHLGKRFRHVIVADDALSVSYVEALRTQGRHGAAAALIIDLLSRHWSADLVRQYGLLEHPDTTPALHQAEQWMTEYGQDAGLYLTLGRLCKQAELWGKAKNYLELSLESEPQVETYGEIAALCEQLDETEAAHQYIKKGMDLATRIT